MDDRENIESASKAVGSQQPFYLAYQGFNDRELQQLYGNLVCRIMAQRYPQFAAGPPLPSYSSRRPLRIGFVSGHFRRHAIWKIPIKGWIQNIDKRRFSLYGYYVGTQKDSETEVARKCFRSLVENVHSFEKLCEIIRNDKLHILIYPEIGMEPMSLRLACLRLAPIQCASWGHPVTSGLPTIDYFLSGDLIEPSDADRHYTERLIRLPNLSVYYEPVEMPGSGLDRRFFGIRSEAIVYHCCQSPYKFLPQYDAVFPRIAQEVGNCQFLFSSDPLSNKVTEQLRSRIRRAFESFNLDYAFYVMFLPFLDTDQYYALYRFSDIFLDPIGWSGCNSTFEAIACNIPTVTHPTLLMRGRESAAILRMMQIEDTIAENIDNYVRIAAKLGSDPKWRREISQKIGENKYLIYRDKTCISALEIFFEEAIRKKQAD